MGPKGLIGGVFLQGWLDYSMTTAVIIGYVSLFAVAIQTGIIMIVFIRQALANRVDGQPYMDAVIEGSAASGGQMPHDAPQENCALKSPSRALHRFLCAPMETVPVG